MSTAPSVLAVVTQFPSVSQTFILRKLTGLRDAGLDISVAATSFTAGAAATGLPLLPLAPWQRPRETFGPHGRAGWSAVARGMSSSQGLGTGLRHQLAMSAMTTARADIVHFEFSGIATTYLPILDRLRPARLAVSCRGAAEQIEPLSNPARAAELAEVFSRVDLIHCVSDDMRRTVLDLGAPADRIVVNRPAVPVADFAGIAERRESHDGPLRVLSVGRLHWKKGLDDGLRAVAAARAAGTPIDYRIAGEGPERAKLTFLVDQLALGPHVELLGSTDQAGIREQLAWADVLLLPSLSEGISNAVLEAMASGLAVIATSSGGMDEAVIDGESGLIVGVGDVEAMAEGLRELGADPDRRRELGVSAATRAVAEFDLSRQVQVFVDAYLKLLASA